MKEQSFELLLQEAAESSSHQKLAEAIKIIEPMLSMFSNRNVYKLEGPDEVHHFYKEGYYLVPESEMKLVSAMRDIYHNTVNRFSRIEDMPINEMESVYAFKEREGTFLTFKKVKDSCVITKMINDLEKLLR